MSPNTGSSDALDTVKGWIQTCFKSHDSCLRLNRIPPLPTRIVEIMGPESVRLRESENEHGRYVCLSHCWGKAGLIQTKSDSLPAHRSSIPWDQLTKTFRDAVDMTRRLGLRYIWIDSLCIVQVRLSRQNCSKGQQPLTEERRTISKTGAEKEAACATYTLAHI